VIVPLIGGFALGQYVPDSYLAHPTQRGIFSMFIAVAMAISAVPVIARILIDLDIMQRELGLVILAAGVIDDLVGWLLLSIIAGLAARAQIQFQAIGLTMVATAAFIAFAYLWGFRLISYILRWVDDRGIVEAGALTVIIVLGFACAIITQAIGVHAVFGAFVGGLMIGRSPRLRRNDRETIASVASGFLAPVFFAYSGLQTDIFALHGLGVLGLVLAVATLGKYLGCGIGGLIGRQRHECSRRHGDYCRPARPESGRADGADVHGVDSHGGGYLTGRAHPARLVDTAYSAASGRTRSRRT
jgi:Kef-type K+ transport system membrane component KefB